MSLHLLWPPPQPLHTLSHGSQARRDWQALQGPCPSAGSAYSLLCLGRPSQMKGQPLLGRGNTHTSSSQPKAPADEIFMQSEGRRPAEALLQELWGCSQGAAAVAHPSFILQSRRDLQCQDPLPTATHTHPNTLQRHLQVRNLGQGRTEGRRMHTLR